MPEGDLKYGQAPFAPVKLGTQIEEYSANPLDLRDFANKPFVHNDKAKKRWFLTAFVEQQDKHLIEVPSDIAAEAILKCQQQINDIHTILTMDKNSDVNLEDLQSQLKKLFSTPGWLGIALQMVDNHQLDIDILNSLIQWQGFYIQFHDVTLHNAHKNDPLISSNNEEYYSNAEQAKTIHDVLFAKIVIDENDRLNQGICHFRHVKEGKCIFHVPSAALYEQYLVDDHYYVTPLYALGCLNYEHFLAGTLAFGRLMHAFLPNGKNNRLVIHDVDLGAALPVEHDYTHFNEDKNNITDVCKNKQQQQHYLQMMSIISNACARAFQQREANRIIDGLNNLGYMLVPSGEIVIKDFVVNIYKELAYFAGMNNVTVKLINLKNNGAHSFTYTIELSVGENMQTFTGNLHDVFSPEYQTAKIQNIETFYQHLQEIQQIKPSASTSTLPTYQAAEQNSKSTTETSSHLSKKYFK